jgi:hypothetical protein
MKYLIYDDLGDVIERNHEAWLRKSRQNPTTSRDTAYLWAARPHPTKADVALIIPPEQEWLLRPEEVLALDTELDLSWEITI